MARYLFSAVLHLIFLDMISDLNLMLMDLSGLVDP